MGSKRPEPPPEGMEPAGIVSPPPPRRRNTDAEHVGNLVILVGRLIQQVRKHDDSNDVVEKAMGYLRRTDLTPSILRGCEERLGLRS